MESEIVSLPPLTVEVSDFNNFVHKNNVVQLDMSTEASPTATKEFGLFQDAALQHPPTLVVSMGDTMTTSKVLETAEYSKTPVLPTYKENTAGTGPCQSWQKHLQDNKNPEYRVYCVFNRKHKPVVFAQKGSVKIQIVNDIQQDAEVDDMYAVALMIPTVHKEVKVVQTTDTC